MAFENFPSVEGTSTPPQKPTKTDSRTYLTIGLLIALLGTWGYIIWDKSQTRETIKQKETQYSAVVSEKDTLQSLLDDATSRYDELKTNNAEKDSALGSKDKEIAQKDRDIAEKRAKIQSLLSKANASKEELSEAKRLIASLNTDITEYKNQIETLTMEKNQLTQEKQVVTEQRDKVSKDYDSVKSVVKERENVIDVGSTLHVSDFNIFGVDVKNSGKEKQTTTAKKVDKLRIVFNIDENRIAPSGEKLFYVCITSPDGKPVSVEALGSGIFTTRDGEEKVFTQKVAVNYVTGKRQTVSFDWKQGADFVTGDYKIEVYQNGFKIGQGVKHFKKGGLF